MILLAQTIGGYSIIGIAIWVIIVAAVIAVLVIVLRKYEIAIPDWVVSIFWILVVAFVGIGALIILSRMAGWIR